MSCLIPTHFFSSFAGFLLNTAPTFIASVTFNTLYYSQPAYLHSLLCFHTPVHFLRSFNTNLLTVPFARTSLGASSFSVTSPKIWNFLPPAPRSCNCPDTFHWHLKTHYCQYQCNWLSVKARLRNDLLCVEWDVKFYTLTHSPQIRHLLILCAFINFIDSVMCQTNDKYWLILLRERDDVRDVRIFAIANPSVVCLSSVTFVCLT